MPEYLAMSTFAQGFKSASVNTCAAPKLPLLWNWATQASARNINILGTNFIKFLPLLFQQFIVLLRYAAGGLLIDFFKTKSASIGDKRNNF